jgi:hypothetical protein
MFAHVTSCCADKQGDTNRFSNVVHRDGILFYIALLCESFCIIFVFIFYPQNTRCVVGGLGLHGSVGCKFHYLAGTFKN